MPISRWTACVLALAMLWYGGEALLARVARWHLSPLSPFAWMLRDLLLPVLWVNGWRRQFVWRGNAMRAGSLSPFSSAR